MKKFKNVLLVLLVGVTFLASTIVFAQGWSGHRGAKFSQNGPAGAGPGRVLRAEMYDARIDVLAELSGLPQDEVKAKLQYKPMWAVLDEVKVDFPTFRKKMHETAKAIVSQAVTDGKITKVQGDFMLERMENGPRQAMGPRGKGSRGGNWGGNN